MWLKNCWYVAGHAADLDDVPFVARRFLDEPVILFRATDGAIAALEDRCPHRLLPLSAGERVEDQIKCGYHGLVFDGQGRCTAVPGQSGATGAIRVRAYPALERYRLIWIWMGDPELADPNLVPAFAWMDDPAWTSYNSYIHIKADYRLLTDNLLDLSHETYIHRKSIGNHEEESIAHYPVRVTKGGVTVIHARRDMLGIVAPPAWPEMLGYDGRIDRLQIASFMVPSFNMTESGARPAGIAEPYQLVGRVMHILTPETAYSTHYFWSVCRNTHIGDPELTRLMGEAAGGAFQEDKETLELQQEVLRECPDKKVPVFAIHLDSAPIQARRMLDELIRRETAEAGFVPQPGQLAQTPLASETGGDHFWKHGPVPA